MALILYLHSMSIANMMAQVVPMSIYGVLKGEHQEVNLLFQGLMAAPDSWDAAQRNMFAKLKKELISHAKAEEETVYPLLREKIENEEIVDEARHEHDQMEKDLLALEAVSPQTDEWTEKLELLQRDVSHHVEEEETILFGSMRRLLTNEEEKLLTQSFVEAKKKELDRLEGMSAYM